MTHDQEWMERKLAEAGRVYNQYAKHLEPERNGEFVAISPDGKVIVGKRDGEVLKHAVDTFGRGNFALVRAGYDVFEDWSYGTERASKEGDRHLAKDQDRIKEQLARERRLYNLYAKHLEPEHNGEFVAISPDGKVIVGKRDGEVLKRAVNIFGRGNFAMARIGHEVMHEWVTVR